MKNTPVTAFYLAIAFTLVIICSRPSSLRADDDKVTPEAGTAAAAVVKTDGKAAEKHGANDELVVLTPHQLRHPRAMGRIERQTRKIDPFGVAMTLEDAKKQKVIVEKRQEQDDVELPKAENILDEALKKISIRGVRPKEKIVMIGPRPVGVGEILQIKHEGVLFKMRLDDVSVRRLVLTDLVTNEKIQLPLHIFPISFSDISRRNGGKPKPPSGASPIVSTIIIE